MKPLQFVAIVFTLCFACWCTAPCLAGQKVQLSNDVEVEHLTEQVWLHVTYTNYPGYGRISANGLIVVDGATAAMIDTPWNDAQTGVLFDWVQNILHATIKHVIVGHAHDDCMGGLAEAHRRGATSYSLDITQQTAKTTGKAVPQQVFSDSFTLKFEQTELTLAYFGAGHTVDNIVTWIPSQKVLFGGCLIKSASSKDLGNTAEADVNRWPETVRKMMAAFPAADIVVPGHGAYGGQELLTHTITLSELAVK